MRVLLIGDSCTDVYVYGDVKRLNPEAPEASVVTWSHSGMEPSHVT